MTSLQLSAIVFVCVFGGALLGMWLRFVLPEQHLNTETKDLVKLGVGLIGTMAALVLGLLVASTKSAFDARSSELTQMAANMIMLDRTLAHYGPESAQIRVMLKLAAGSAVSQLWPKSGQGEGGFDARTNREVVLDQIEELAPRTDIQRALQSQAESMAFNLGQTRWLLFEQNHSSISTPFLVVVVFWLTILFVSLGLFAPRNATALVTLLVSALSVTGAIFLILDLDHPFTGLMQISNIPLRSAITVLGR